MRWRLMRRFGAVVFACFFMDAGTENTRSTFESGKLDDLAVPWKCFIFATGREIR